MANPHAIFRILDFFTSKNIDEIFTAKQIGNAFKESRAKITSKLIILHEKGMLERKIVGVKPTKTYGYLRKSIQEHRKFLTEMYAKGWKK